MMDFELRAKKIQKEADLRINEAKRRKEREHKLLQEQKQREQKMREIAEESRLKLIALEEERVEHEKLIYSKTGGINFCLQNLIPYEIDGEDDKVILPESSLMKLDEQHAISSGPLLFQLSYQPKIIQNNQMTISSDITTHCGVREFSATEGTIGLPPKVINSLLKHADGSISDLHSVSIVYTRLPKITNAKFAPVMTTSSESIFQVGPIKLVLEENLRSHSTLSVGDHVSVWHRGRRYELRVMELQPESSGSLFNADVEVEFVSAEHAQAFDQLPPPKIAKDNTNATFGNSVTTIKGPSSSSSNANNGGSTTNSMGNSTGYRLNSGRSSGTNLTVLAPTSRNQIQSDTYDLSPEPDATVSDNEVVHMRVRLPTGAPLTRRFMKSQRLVDLFYFICQNLNIHPDQLQVTLPSKNRTLTWSEVGSLPVDSLPIPALLERSSSSESDVTFESFGLLKREMVIASIVSH